MENADNEKFAIHFSYEPVICEEQLLFKNVDFDSFVIICKSLAGFKITDYLTIATGNYHYSLEFKQKKSVHYLLKAEKGEKISVFVFYESLFGNFGSYNGTLLKSVFKFKKSVQFEIEIFQNFFDNIVNETALELYNITDVGELSNIMFIKPKSSNSRDLETEIIRIHGECWENYSRIFTNKLNTFKEKHSIEDIFFYIAKHGIRTDVKLRKEYLYKYLGDFSKLIVVQFHVAIEVIDANYMKSFDNKETLISAEEDNKAEKHDSVYGSILLFRYSNLPTTLPINKYCGISQLRNFGYFASCVDENFKECFATAEYDYLENDANNFKFDKSISYISCYNTLYKPK